MISRGLLFISTLLWNLLTFPSGAQIPSRPKPELIVQTGHSSSIEALAFSLDGRILASASDDGTVRVWDVINGWELRTLRVREVQRLDFSRDLTVLSINSGKSQWDLSTGMQIEEPAKKYPDDFAVAFHGLAAHVSATDRFKVVVTDSALRKPSRSVGHPGPIGDFSLSPDDSILATGGWDNCVVLWDASTGKFLNKLGCHTDGVTALAFSADGNTLASGSSDTTIKLWDVRSRTEKRTLLSYVDSAISLAMSPNGKTLVSGGGSEEGREDEDFIKVWSVKSGQMLTGLSAKLRNVKSLLFSPDDQWLVAQNENEPVLRFWDARTLRERPLEDDEFPIYTTSVYATGKQEREEVSYKSDVLLTFNRSGSRLVGARGGYNSGGGETTTNIKKRDTSTGKVIRSFDIKDLYPLALSRDGTVFAGRVLVSVEGENRLIRLWNTQTGREIPSDFSEREDEYSGFLWGPTIDDPNSAMLSDDGKLFLTSEFVEGKYQVTAFDVRTARKLWTQSDSFLRALGPDSQMVACQEENGIIIRDLQTGKMLHSLAGLFGDSIVFSRDGRLLITGGIGAITLWDVKLGKELASLIALDLKEWVVITPDGLFDGTPTSWNQILWRFSKRLEDVAPVEAFFSEFYYPDLLPDLLAGVRPMAPERIEQRDLRQPELILRLVDSASNRKLGAEASTIAATTREVTVQIEVSDAGVDVVNQRGSGARDVRLFRNGSLVKVWRGDVLKGKRSAMLEVSVSLVAGENRLFAYAFNEHNIKSMDKRLSVIGADSLKRAGTAYILAVGVDRYNNPEYNLKYAVTDAQEFSAEFERQQQVLKNYARVDVQLIFDEQATKSNIMQRLTQFAEYVQPEDAVVVYFSGHGTARQNKFYLIPHDLGYDGPRTKLDDAALQTILTHSISDRELEQVFEKIDSGQILLVIDACNSGQALEADEKRRGPMNSKGLAQLAYEKGMYVLTAAQRYQAAIEAGQLGHGLLSYALVDEGLKTNNADSEPRDGILTAREWLDFATERVPQMQEEKIHQSRGIGLGLAFTYGEEEIDPAKRSLQRPRAFYRRELEASPFVVTGSATDIAAVSGPGSRSPIARWIDLQTATLGVRYRFVANS